MKVIDMHTHVAYAPVYPAGFLDELAADLAGGVPGLSQHSNTGKIRALVRGLLKDEHCDQLVRQMDKAGVERAVLLIIDAEFGMGKAGFDIERIFEHHHKVLEKHPTRFSVFAGIDPRRGVQGLELFKRSITQLGFTGLKLYPPMGYAMDHPGLMPYYELCHELRLPVLIHTGPSFPTLHNELAHPEAIIPIARKFPQARFILAHAGMRIGDRIITDLIAMPNVYADISGFQKGFRQGDKRFWEGVSKVFSPEYNRKILFGSDWPLFHLMATLSSNVDFVGKLFSESIFAGSNEALENVMYNNAHHILSGSNES